ncbi:serine hydrolase [Streptomyces sp. NPDC048430]|uniref:serine hydrolase n=1 Tax=Streptomyces sp. NPDC048430 TaxID=3155388 RepID=UPI003437D987
MRTPEYLTRALDAESVFEPGEDWGYSNTNYLVLGMVIDKASGLNAFWDGLFGVRLLPDRALRATVWSISRARWTPRCAARATGEIDPRHKPRT